MTSVCLAPTASGGLSTYRNLDAQVTGTIAKASAGQLYGWQIHNRAASVRHLKVYNKATAPTGADTPILTISLPPAWESVVTIPQGLRFNLGLSIRGTQLVADADATAPTANDIVAHLFYA